jgi:thiamine-monophosphate kinase
MPAAGAGSSEFDIIRRFFSGLDQGPGVDLGVGDDCALLQLPPDRRLAVSVDTVVEGVHFPAGEDPADLGYRAVAVAASDLAGVGAAPLASTVALTLPQADTAWLRGFGEGLAAVVADCRLPLVGGDTTRGPLAVSVTVLGSLPRDRALLRSGARAGDRLCVSGTLGDGAAALGLLQDAWRPPPEHARYLRRRFWRPAPRLALGQQLLGVASAAIDLSDGLVADAGHIAAASGVRLRIRPDSLPLSPALAAHPDRLQALRWALTGGDDYELCFCLPADRPLPAGCAVIGEVAAGAGVDPGMALDTPGGYRHF